MRIGLSQPAASPTPAAVARIDRPIPCGAIGAPAWSLERARALAYAPQCRWRRALYQVRAPWGVVPDTISMAARPANVKYSA